MGAALELLTAILVLVSSTQDGDDFLLGGQGDGAGDGSVGALGGLDDLLSGLVDQLMIIGLQTNRSFLSELPLGCSSLNTYEVDLVSCCRASYGESFSCTRFRAYHSQSRKNRLIDRPVFSLPGDLRRGTDLSAARFSDILRESYLVTEQSPASSQTARFSRA